MGRRGSISNSATSANDDKGSKNMAEPKAQFVGFDIPKLREQYPSGFKRSSKPSVSVNGNGRIVFSSLASEVFKGATVVLPSFDAAGNRMRFDGLDNDKGKEGKTLEIVMPKGKDGKAPKSKSVSVSAAVLLKHVNYDYKKAGNQTFDIDKIVADKRTIIFALPTTTPTAKPKTERKKKAVAAPAQAGLQVVNGGAPAAPSAASLASMGKKADSVDDLQIDDVQ